MARVALLMILLAALGYISQAIPVLENVENALSKFEIPEVKLKDTPKEFENKIKKQLGKENDFSEKIPEIIKEFLQNNIQMNEVFGKLLRIQEETSQSIQHALTNGIQNIDNVNQITENIKKLTSIIKEMSKTFIQYFNFINRTFEVAKTIGKSIDGKMDIGKILYDAGRFDEINNFENMAKEFIKNEAKFIQEIEDGIGNVNKEASDIIEKIAGDEINGIGYTLKNLSPRYLL